MENAVLKFDHHTLMVAVMHVVFYVVKPTVWII